MKKHAASGSVRKPPKSKRGKKRFHLYVLFLIIWLIAVTCAVRAVYDRFNEFLIKYEASYQASLPVQAADEIFAHYRDLDIDYIWDNMSERPEISFFETDEDVKDYIADMLEGKTLSYREDSGFTPERPSYVVEADGYLIGTIRLKKDPQAKREYGFPTYVLDGTDFFTEPLEYVTVRVPEGSTVYINNIALDDSFVTSTESSVEDQSYIEPYGTFPGFVTYNVSGLYREPDVSILDVYGEECLPDYDEGLKTYSCGFTHNHPDKEMIEEFGIEFACTFANVISRDDSLENLYPYFTEDSATPGYISRNTALLYYMSHSSVSIENIEVQDFIAYRDDIVYMEVSLEQHMQMYYGDPEPVIVPTDARFYLVRVDGQWKVCSMRF